MKYFLVTLIIQIITLSSSSAWVIEDPIDYPKLMLDSNFSGVVKVVEARDTGTTKVFFNDGVKFREVLLKLEVLSTLKGVKPKTLNLSIYRIPTIEELEKDGFKKKW